MNEPELPAMLHDVKYFLLVHRDSIHVRIMAGDATVVTLQITKVKLDLF